jgi:hypothetical protein
MSEIRELTTDELDFVCGAATPAGFKLDLGNMKIGGYVDGEGHSMGWADNGAGTVVITGMHIG